MNGAGELFPYKLDTAPIAVGIGHTGYVGTRGEHHEPHLHLSGINAIALLHGQTSVERIDAERNVGRFVALQHEHLLAVVDTQAARMGHLDAEATLRMLGGHPERGVGVHAVGGID